MIQEATMAAFFLVFLTGVFVTVKTKFVQFSSMRNVFKKLFDVTSSSSSSNRMNPRQALFLTLSTTIGVGSVVGPVIALNFGGPGALIWFMLSSIISSSVIYAEIVVAFNNRSPNENSTVIGPMAHLRKISSWLAICYAISTTALLLCWTSSQAVILSKIGSRSFPISGLTFSILIATSVVIVIYKGIKWITEIMDTIVPVMIIAYVIAILINISYNASNIIPSLKEMFESFFAFKSFATGVGSFTAIDSIRWGIARSLAAIEAGCGTTSIAHSMSSSKDAKLQAKMGVLAAYINCVVGFLSAFSVMVSGTLQKFPFLTDIDLIEKTFSVGPYNIGIILIRIAIFLFAYGTVLGNCFNGKICFEYLTGKKYVILYALMSGVPILIGYFYQLKFILEIADILFITVLASQMTGILYWLIKEPKTFE